MTTILIIISLLCSGAVVSRRLGQALKATLACSAR